MLQSALLWHQWFFTCTLPQMKKKHTRRKCGNHNARIGIYITNSCVHTGTLTAIMGYAKIYLGLKIPSAWQSHEVELSQRDHMTEERNFYYKVMSFTTRKHSFVEGQKPSRTNKSSQEVETCWQRVDALKPSTNRLSC
jgi:hypothetical protein